MVTGLFQKVVQTRTPKWPMDRISSNLSGILRGFDSAFVMQQISNQMVKDGVSDSFMSDEDINEWLSIYKDNVGDENLTTDELLLEFNLFMPYVALGLTYYNLCNPLNTDLRCASLSLCGVEFVSKKERREKEGAAEFRIEKVTEIITYIIRLNSEKLIFFLLRFFLVRIFFLIQ